MRRTMAMALAVGLALAAAPVAAREPETLRFTGAQWWTPDGFEGGDRYVRGGVFVAPAKRARTIDLAGAFVVPPFGEAHNHNLDAPALAKTVSDQYLANGVFYVKNPNSSAVTSPRARALLNRPDTVDARFSMGGLTAEGGHPIRLYGFLSRFSGPERPGEAFEGDAFHVIRTAADIEPALGKLQGQGAEFVKTYLLHSESYEERKEAKAYYGMRGLDPKLYPTIVRAAHRRGLKVSVHIETAADFRLAVASGVDEINHLPGYMWSGVDTAATYALTAEDARAAARAGVVVVTTTVITNGINMPRARKAQVKAVQTANLRLLRAAGVKLAIGSDNYMTTSRSEIDNLAAMKVFDNATLLRLWIETPKVSIFPERRLSCLERGCEADFLVLSADPIRDLAATKAIAGAWKDGAPLTLVPAKASVVPGPPGGGGHVH
ncbi:MAG TPA: amidohydrolase family protein [Caulobacter sp.]|nr:amidohydrolase family protein [Caulobacter sp.]